MRSARINPIRSILIAMSLLFGSSPLLADDGYLVFNTVAWHAKNADERNAVTPGIGWEYSPSNRIGFHIGTVSDSFGYQATYGGLNYATPRFFYNRARFILAATILRKQYRVNAGPETKIVPLPALELSLSKNAVLNLSGSPEVDYGDHHNNAVLFFQLKLNLL